MLYSSWIVRLLDRRVFPWLFSITPSGAVSLLISSSPVVCCFGWLLSALFDPKTAHQGGSFEFWIMGAIGILLGSCAIVGGLSFAAILLDHLHYVHIRLRQFRNPTHPI